MTLDKFVLILNFLFVILSYYFFLFMDSDLSEASNTPISNSNDLYSGLTLQQKVIIVKGELEFEARFINWDQATCFLKVDGSINDLNGKVTLKWKFEGIEYLCRGVIVSGSRGLGVGVRLAEDKLDNVGVFGWGDFYDIVYSRGYSPTLTA